MVKGERGGEMAERSDESKRLVLRVWLGLRWWRRRDGDGVEGTGVGDGEEGVGRWTGGGGGRGTGGGGMLGGRMMSLRDSLRPSGVKEAASILTLRREQGMREFSVDVLVLVGRRPVG
jgi:hypothetical protein